MTKAFASAVVAALLMLMAASTMALGFGANTNYTTLGQPLNYTVVLRLDPGEVVSQECVVADVQIGESAVPAAKVRAVLTAGAAPNERLVRISTSSLVDEPVIGVGVTVNCPSRIARRFVAFVDPPKKSSGGPTLANAAALRQAEPVATAPLSEVLQSAMSLTAGSSRSQAMAGESGDGTSVASVASVDTRRRMGSRNGANAAGSAGASDAVVSAGAAGTAGAAGAAGAAGVARVAGAANGNAGVMAATTTTTSTPAPAQVASTSTPTRPLDSTLTPYVGSARNDRTSPDDDADSLAAATSPAAAPVMAGAAKRAAKNERGKVDLASADHTATTAKTGANPTRHQQLAAARAAAKDQKTQVASAAVKALARSVASPVVIAPANGSTVATAATTASTATTESVAAAAAAAGKASTAAADVQSAQEQVRALAAEMAATQT
ncbi:MAG: hypothetical protein JWQ11_340, partial [Rhizobacter sp.]|nr:hypothetical protein [Rhizobacter sp.]